MKVARFFIYKALITMMFSVHFASSTWAASFSISPMSINLSEKDKIAVLNLKNVADEPVVLQLQAKEWQQSDGKDTYSSTKNLIIAPPLVKIDPQEEQVIRISLRKCQPSNQERAYRLFIEEIPQPSSTPKAGIQTVLSVSLPVFIQPHIPIKPGFSLSASRKGKDSLRLTLLNKGNAHLKVTGLKLFPQKGANPIVENAVLDYILALKSKEWDVTLPALFKGNQIMVTIETNQGELSEVLPLLLN